MTTIRYCYPGQAPVCFYARLRHTAVRWLKRLDELELLGLKFSLASNIHAETKQGDVNVHSDEPMVLELMNDFAKSLAR